MTYIDQRHARGIDFRAATEDGISLLITCPVNSDRALVQLLGRVGRYGQRCSRFLLDTVKEPVDANEDRKLRQKFSTILENISMGTKTGPLSLTPKK